MPDLVQRPGVRIPECFQQLARLEIRVLFEELAKRVESVDFAPGTTLEYEPSFILRGLKQLELDVVRRAS